MSGEFGLLRALKSRYTDPTPRFALPLPFKEWEGSWGAEYSAPAGGRSLFRLQENLTDAGEIVCPPHRILGGQVAYVCTQAANLRTQAANQHTQVAYEEFCVG